MVRPGREIRHICIITIYLLYDVDTECNLLCSGSGKGQMAAWKASKVAKEYEAQGG